MEESHVQMLTSTLQPGAVVFQSPFVTRMLKEPNVVLSASKLVEEFENLLQLARMKKNDMSTWSPPTF